MARAPALKLPVRGEFVSLRHQIADNIFAPYFNNAPTPPRSTSLVSPSTQDRDPLKTNNLKFRCLNVQGCPLIMKSNRRGVPAYICIPSVQGCPLVLNKYLQLSQTFKNINCCFDKLYSIYFGLNYQKSTNLEVLVRSYVSR